MSHETVARTTDDSAWTRENRCGVAVFALDPWAVLDRFLILGVTGGTYYATEQELRVEHLRSLLALLDADGPRVVARVVEISRSGRAPRNQPAVAALALAASVGLKQPKSGHFVSADRTGDTPARAETRRLALAALPKVCRIPTDLFAFTVWIRRLRGFGPAVSKAVANWYLKAPIERLALHGLKYESRKGVAHADLLRLAHPRVSPLDGERTALVHWLLGGGIKAGLEARLAARAQGVEGNPTPSAALRQLEGAEDLLLVNRMGAGRAAERAAERAEARRVREAQRAAERAARDAERARLRDLAAAFEEDYEERRDSRRSANDDTRKLYGISSSLMEAAYGLSEEALPYVGEHVDADKPWFAEGEEPRWEAPISWRRPARRPRHAREQDNFRAPEPQPSLFTPDEVAEACDLIRRCSLPHEVVPSHLKRERDVWDALLVDMPMQAMIRNLAVMTRVGLLAYGNDAVAYVASRLRDPVLVANARIHPLLVLQAAESYRMGRDRDVIRYAPGRGGLLRPNFRRPRNLSWTPVQAILDALDDCFHLAFANVTPANVRLMLGVDVSGSMESAYIGDSWLSARMAAAAMCLVTARTEARWHAVGYTSSGYGYHWGRERAETDPREVYPGLMRLPLSRDLSVAEVARRTGALPMGSTDCALPIKYALEKEIEIDAFVSYTDNEHNSGDLTPAEALAKYRAASGIDARLICVGMTATDYTIANPRDPLCLNLVGFDAAAPRILADFAAGRL